MSDAAALRAEIKAWEKDFKAQNGRAAAIEDIKQLPHIEEKYKLYKRLSKQKQAFEQPSTPPRTTASLLKSRSRAVEGTEPLQSFNPFSPTKPKRKADVSPTTPRRNLFATPKKSKSKPRSTTPDDPFQDEIPVQQPTSAVSRARKRLRGEPVSPSPKKDKRRRLSISNTPRTRQASPSFGSAVSGFAPVQAYIEDSPVKAPKGGRSFQGLFEEEPIIPSVSRLEFSALSVNSGPSSLQAARSTPAPFHDQPKLLKKKKGVSNYIKDLSKGVRIPTKSSLFDTRDSQEAKSETTPKNPITDGMDLDTELDTKFYEGESHPEYPNAVPISHPQLLPPSPPPSESTQGGSSKGGKTKVAGLKGKSKLTNINNNSASDEEEEGVSSDGLAVRYVEQPFHTGEGLDEDEDDPASVVIRTRRSPRTNGVEDDSHFDITAVPSSLLSVLAISPTSKVKEKERMYRGLVYGRREGHYDPSCGGEIWGAGEDSEPDGEKDMTGRLEEEVDEERGGSAQQAWRKAVDIEDDEWEGEPVPWEVGEL